MSSFCSTCGKPIRHSHHDFDHHGHRSHHHGHHHDHHHNHQRHHGHHHDHYDNPHFHHDGCICESFFCDDRFKVRLGGLTSNLNFRLRQLIGCEVNMRVECGDECEDILAEICYVGNDFVEVKVLEKIEDQLIDDDVEEVESADEEIESIEEEEEEEQRKRKKNRKKEFAIFPMESVKRFELKDDCDCDCHHDHHHNHHDCDCC